MLNDLRDLLPAFAHCEDTEPDRYPAGPVADLHAAGILRAPFPVALGGENATLADAVQTIESIAQASPSLALIAAMPVGLAGVFALGPHAAPPEHRPAWSAQIERVAAAFRAGELFAACNSEKGAGGSLAATRTEAHARPGGGFAVSGEKILASSGRFATCFFSTARVDPNDLPGAGVVEFFVVRTTSPGVAILEDWDGFGMRSTESQTVRYTEAPAEYLLGFPDFIRVVQPLEYFFCLFAAIPLGCVKAMLAELSRPAVESAALRSRFADAQMQIESLESYLLQTASGWRAAAGPGYAARVLRTKTFVTREAARLAADLFALGGGRHYRRDGRLARLFAAVFAGTALRPPLALGLEALSQPAPDSD